MGDERTDRHTAALLAAYDMQMRMPLGAVPTGVTYEHDGPILRIVGEHVGRIRGPRDAGVTGAALDRLIARQRDYFQARGQSVEWKLRSHDLPADLPERLVAAGFVRHEPSTVLLGFADDVAAEPVLPDGIVLRRVSEAEDMRRIADHQTEVWGLDCSWVAAHLVAQVSADASQITILVAEAVSGSPVPPGRSTTRAPISSRCSAARRCRTGVGAAPTVRCSRHGPGRPLPVASGCCTSTLPRPAPPFCAGAASTRSPPRRTTSGRRRNSRGSKGRTCHPDRPDRSMPPAPKG